MKRLIILALFFLSSTICNKIIYFSIDERFATRGMFINLAQLVNDKSLFDVLTPPQEYICHYKVQANLTLLDLWLQNETKLCNQTKCLFVMSSEMFLFGGLINSRISNDSLLSVFNRLDKINDLKEKFQENVKIYFSNVIMRIPNYNGDFEEPWYWKNFGFLIYSWSFYIDRYYVLKNISDYEIALNISKKIPIEALTEFQWRRERNHNVTLKVLEYQQKFDLFEKIWITLDDNAEYGLNRMEERDIRQKVSNMSLNSSVNIYPGADEVGLVMLSKLIVDENKKPPSIKVVYRNETTKNRIPNFEGQSLNISVQSQVIAAGGLLVNDSMYDLLVLVNNWSTDDQHEADEQQTPDDYSVFEQYQSFNGIVIFADVRFSNGGDIFLIEWIKNNSFRNKFGSFTYAGWNTAGNTIGTCISNGILLYITKSLEENKLFTYYRLIEDITYQAEDRQKLSYYLNFVSLENISDDFDFYEKYISKGFQASLVENMINFENNSNRYVIENVYYPWNRTFEIGLTIVKKNI